MKLKTKLKLKILGNTICGFLCSTGVAFYPNFLAKLFYGICAILAFAMAANNFDKYPTDD